MGEVGQPSWTSVVWAASSAGGIEVHQPARALPPAGSDLTMRAMVLTKLVSLRDLASQGDGAGPLELVDLPIPEPRAGEVWIRVSACGVCHTELDEIEGRAAPPRLPVVPGHEIVGHVERRGPRATRHRLGDRVGVGWIYSSTGRRDENLSPEFRATGRDV